MLYFVTRQSARICTLGLEDWQREEKSQECRYRYTLLVDDINEITGIHAHFA
jgi:hypothetical protein